MYEEIRRNSQYLIWEKQITKSQLLKFLENDLLNN